MSLVRAQSHRYIFNRQACLQQLDLTRCVLAHARLKHKHCVGNQCQRVQQCVSHLCRSQTNWSMSLWLTTKCCIAMHPHSTGRPHLVSLMTGITSARTRSGWFAVLWPLSVCLILPSSASMSPSVLSRVSVEKTWPYACRAAGWAWLLLGTEMLMQTAGPQWCYGQNSGSLAVSDRLQSRDRFLFQEAHVATDRWESL